MVKWPKIKKWKKTVDDKFKPTGGVLSLVYDLYAYICEQYVYSFTLSTIYKLAWKHHQVNLNGHLFSSTD